MTDVTAHEQHAATEAVLGSRRNSAPIQQALGVLMAAYGLSEEAAMNVLRRHSSHRNVKLSELARRVMVGSSTGELGENETCRTALDRVLIRE